MEYLQVTIDGDYDDDDDDDGDYDDDLDDQADYDDYGDYGDYDDNAYLIFVIFFTLPHFEAWKFYTQKCVNSRQKLPRDKTA